MQEKSLNVVVGVEFMDEFVEVRQAGFGNGVAERWNVLGGININWRETIGNGCCTNVDIKIIVM
ncbi:hypothetical protein Goari_009453 [Gossypium aridum]|uniref:Uncharacterized protein n=1 Tax=Gossypium aridum TaxID=34290 RepID=A0A7J8XX30_GOSAI|nr:hypothetical protein [Gossypium aridum]